MILVVYYILTKFEFLTNSQKVHLVWVKRDEQRKVDGGGVAVKQECKKYPFFRRSCVCH